MKVNHRYLVKISTHYLSDLPAEEVRVLEISPSGNWIQLEYQGGHHNWIHVSKIDVIEDLGD